MSCNKLDNQKHLDVHLLLLRLEEKILSYSNEWWVWWVPLALPRCRQMLSAVASSGEQHRTSGLPAPAQQVKQSVLLSPSLKC